MRVLHILARVAFRAPFAVLGFDAAKDPGGRVQMVEAFGIPQAKR